MQFTPFINGLCIYLLTYPYAPMGGQVPPLDATNTQRHTCQTPLILLCLYQAQLELPFKQAQLKLDPHEIINKKTVKGCKKTED